MSVDDDAIRELRVGDRELREGIEEASAHLARAKRALDDVALEFMHRGDTVRVTVGQRSWTGVIVHVGSKLLTLRAQSGTTIDIDLGKLTSLAVVNRSSAGGRSSGIPDPPSLIARLRELEQTSAVVELGGAALEAIRVQVLAVAQTHAETRAVDGTEWVIPLASIAYVVNEQAID